MLKRFNLLQFRHLQGSLEVRIAATIWQSQEGSREWCARRTLCTLVNWVLVNTLSRFLCKNHARRAAAHFHRRCRRCEGVIFEEDQVHVEGDNHKAHEMPKARFPTTRTKKPSMKMPGAGGHRWYRESTHDPRVLRCRDTGQKRYSAGPSSVCKARRIARGTVGQRPLRLSGSRGATLALLCAPEPQPYIYLYRYIYIFTYIYIYTYVNNNIHRLTHDFSYVRVCIHLVFRFRPPPAGHVTV